MDSEKFIRFHFGVVLTVAILTIFSCDKSKSDDPIPPTAKQFQMIQAEYPEATRLITTLFLVIENKLLPFDSFNQEFQTKWNCVQNAWYNHQYSVLDAECPLEEKIADELLAAAHNIPHPVLQPCNEKCFGNSAPLPVQINCLRDCVGALAKQHDSIPATTAFKEIQSNPRYAEAVKLLNSLLISFADTSPSQNNVKLARNCAMEAWFNHSFTSSDCPIENQLATHLLAPYSCTRNPLTSNIKRIEKCCEECKRFLDGATQGDSDFQKCVSDCLIR